MSVVSNAQRNALYSQHSLDSQDWQRICQLSGLNINQEKQMQQIASFTFEQFFGLAVHSFITTQSPTTRQQLAAILPKFGSRTVLSLCKVLLHFDELSTSSNISTANTNAVNTNTVNGSADLRTLSLRSLNDLAPTDFVVGLESVLSDEKADALMPTVLKVLLSAIRKNDGVVLTLLPRLLSAQSWQKLRRNLVAFPAFSAVQSNLPVQPRREIKRQRVFADVPSTAISA